jgi:transcriptional regulator with GAF, ATPase, and Fis domain
VLHEGEIRRVGENKSRRVNARVVAATNANIREVVRKGSFREDLFYRLNVVSLEVPPLRERCEDIPALIQKFLEESRERLRRPRATISGSAVRLLCDAPWPGNVRELENLIEKALILADDDEISGDFVAELLESERAPSPPRASPPPFGSGESQPLLARSSAPHQLITLDEFDKEWQAAERGYLLQLVEASNWNFAAAARLARVKNRNTLISRLRKHQINRPEPLG